MKPVAAGIASGADWSDDVAALAAASTIAAARPDVNPYSFAPPIAPHIAAARAGTTIELDAIAAAYRRLAARAEAIVVEGAGGALVPLGARADMLDIAARLSLPVVLVVGVRLGCLNHAMLSEHAIRMRGLVLAGWVANRIDRAMAEADANVATLARRLAAPLVADLEWHEREAPAPPTSRAALATLRLVD
jgi:dethiobiotin synthetase